MEHLVDHSTDSSAARPAQHPLIIRQYTFREAFAQCLSKHSPATTAHMQRVAEAFFQQLPATELTCAEVDLLNSLIHVAESVQAALPPSVSLQDWAQRRVPRGFERQVNSSGIVYVGGSILRTQLPLHKPAGSAAQPTSRSTATQPASVVEEFVFDDDGLYDFDLEAFFRQCPRTSFGNLGERQWFVHRTHRCLKCINRLAWTCKQIHIWFYTTFEARKLKDTEDSSSSESISSSTRKTAPSSDADKDDERQTSEARQPEYLERDEETSSSLRRARKNFKRGKTLKKEKQEQLQQTIQSQIQPTLDQDQDRIMADQRELQINRHRRTRRSGMNKRMQKATATQSGSRS